MKLDILAFGAHPDDVELGAGGILATHAASGKKVGIVDLTRGEMGSRGTPELRDAEALEAAQILGCAVRENLYMSDGQVSYDFESQLLVAKIVRKYQPDIVLMNAPTDRHPDHGRASRLVEEACFISGLHKIELDDKIKRAFDSIQESQTHQSVILALKVWGRIIGMVDDSGHISYSDRFVFKNDVEDKTVIKRGEYDAWCSDPNIYIEFENQKIFEIEIREEHSDVDLMEILYM